LSISCFKCGSTKNLQVHHLSYKPEIVVWVCTQCHLKLHKNKHGVGAPQGWKGYSSEEIKKVISLWKKGCTLDKIRSEVGPAPNTTAKWIKKQGLTKFDREAIPDSGTGVIKVYRVKNLRKISKYKSEAITENDEKIICFHTPYMKTVRYDRALLRIDGVDVLEGYAFSIAEGQRSPSPEGTAS